MRRTSMLAASVAGLSGTIAAILLAGSAWAGAACLAPRDEAALKTAALQQYLMVAALTCHDTGAYNDFVMSHRGELQESDRNLLNFFLSRSAESGDADYNAYKTWLANVSSMRSLHDPRFCRIAFAAFDAALDGSKPLAAVVAERPVPVYDGAMSCTETATNEPAAADDGFDGPMQRHASLKNR